MTIKNVLLTGATGYIATHTWIELLRAGYRVVGIDNLCNSSAKVLERIAMVTSQTPVFVQGDVRDRVLVDKVLRDHDIDAVVHFAALKAVGESVSMPLSYYTNNLGSLIALCEAMEAAGIYTLVFSSSATVYGNPHTVPIQEDFPLSATNPYGQTKLMSEQILRDVERANPKWRIGYLRYFNPVGAHESGLLGEDPRGIPNNLMPYVARVAAGKLERLNVFGGDYPTPDGTGVRDYIHVVDLATGHLRALDYLATAGEGITVNLGTGQGYSVLEVVAAYEKAAGRPIPYTIAARRTGDIATCYANPSLAEEKLGWRAERSLEDMCRDSWRWQSTYPNGFDD